MNIEALKIETGETTAAQVERDLREAIIRLELKPGTRLSEQEIATRLGVSRQTINAVETDKYDPSLPLALRMAKLFEVPVDQLFLDTWEPSK